MSIRFFISLLLKTTFVLFLVCKCCEFNQASKAVIFCKDSKEGECILYTLMSIYWRCALLLGTTESTVNMICHTISNLFYFYTFFIKCSESNWSSLNVNILALINKKELTFFLDYWVCIATATIVGVFYNGKNRSSFITSKSSSKNLSNSRELAF